MDVSWMLLLCNVVVSGAGILLFVACTRFVILRRPCKTERTAILLSFSSMFVWWIVAAFLIFWLLPESGLSPSSGITDFIIALFASKILSPSVSLKRRRKRNAKEFRSVATAEPTFVDLVEGFQEAPSSADDILKLKNKVRILLIVVVALCVICAGLCVKLATHSDDYVAGEKAAASIFVEYEQLSAAETLSYEDSLNFSRLKDEIRHYTRKYYGLEDW